MAKQKALVTGATGFIGSHLVTALEEKNYVVISLPHEVLGDVIGLRQTLQDTKPDYIFHLAAYGNMYQQRDNEQEIFDANLIKTWNLLQASKNVAYKAFINVSSSSVTLPHQTMYAATKLGGEALCRAFVDEYKKPIVTVRPYSVYGPGEADHRFIPTVFRSCLTEEGIDVACNPVHDWVYIDDLVKVLLAATQLKEFDGKPFGCGTGRATTNLTIMRAIEGITRKNCNYRFIDNMRSFDNKDWVDKVQKPDNYIDIYQGLQKCYEYYKERYEK